MPRYRIVKAWTFRQWQDLSADERPHGVRPCRAGWVLLEEVAAVEPPMYRKRTTLIPPGNAGTT